jgi:hypothetical protein
MKKKMLIQITFFAFLVISFTNFRCNKNNTNDFCEVQRTEYLTVDDRHGMIGYYAKYNRWAIYANISTPNNIDSRIVGMLCDIPETMKSDGLRVIFSGKYNKFNISENISPQIGGEELYYLSLSKIAKE